MKKSIKRIVSLLLSLVLVFGGIPSFVSEVRADDDFYIYCTPLIQNSEVGDVKFSGAGIDGFGFETIDEVKWYKVADDDSYTLMNSNDWLENGSDYLVSMIWHERYISMDNDTKFHLGDAYSDVNISTAEFKNENDICTPAASEQKGFFKELSVDNTKDRQIVFYIDGTTVDRDIISMREKLELQLFVATKDSPTEDDLVPIEWYDIAKDGFDISRLYVGKMAEDAINNKANVTNMTNPDVTTIEKGEEIHFSFSYKSISGDYKKVSLNGKYLFNNNNDNSLNDLSYYWWDDTNQRITFNVKGTVLDDIDNVEFLNPYIGESFLHFKVKEDVNTVTFDEDCHFEYRLYEGTFDKTSSFTNDFNYNTSLVDVGQIDWTFSPLSIDSATNTFDFYTLSAMFAILDDKDYTIVLRELYDYDQIANEYFINFHPTRKSNYELFIGGMKRDESISDWIDNNYNHCLLSQTVQTSIHWLDFKLLALDEYPSITLDSKFDDKTKLNVTFMFKTSSLPESVELVKGNSDYQSVRLTRNTNMDFFGVSKEFYDLKNDEMIGAIEAYKGYENQYNYQLEEGNNLPFPVYEIICKVTLDFSPVHTSSGSKKYTVKNINTSAEKIAGSGKKGSKRTITPIEGKKVGKVTVTDKDGNPVEVVKNEDGTYSFKQPASNVEVEVTYVNREITLNIGSTEADVDGEKSNLDVCPVIRNDRTMLPIRFVAENLGAKVEWDEKNPDYVLITKGDIKIEITLGSDVMKVNGKDVKLDSIAFAENDRTYLPVRAISENLNAIVEWNEAKPMEVKIYER